MLAVQIFNSVFPSDHRILSPPTYYNQSTVVFHSTLSEKSPQTSPLPTNQVHSMRSEGLEERAGDLSARHCGLEASLHLGLGSQPSLQWASQERASTKAPTVFALEMPGHEF